MYPNITKLKEKNKNKKKGKEKKRKINIDLAVLPSHDYWFAMGYALFQVKPMCNSVSATGMSHVDYILLSQ